jgi:hypothetical protein
MIDAYTIGITLALDNGVSAGLTTIRNDLVILNKVVDGSTTRLKQLTQVAGCLQLRPFGPELAAKGRDSSPREVNVQTISVPSNPPSTNGAVPTWSQLNLPRLTKTYEDVLLGPASQPNTNRESLAVSSGPITSSSSVLDSPNSRPHVELQAGERTLASNTELESYRARASLPIQSTAAPVQPTAVFADASRDRSSLSPMAAAVDRPVSINTSPPRTSTDALRTQVSPPRNYAPSHLSTQRPADRHPGVSAIARSVPGDTTSRTQPIGAGAALPSAVPPPTGPQSTTVHGDVYLDGSRLGRWMTDSLVRAAELPRSATTGFDPRLTATWPGAAVST